jgi:hypothetical protein
MRGTFLLSESVSVAISPVEAIKPKLQAKSLAGLMLRLQ